MPKRTLTNIQETRHYARFPKAPPKPMPVTLNVTAGITKSMLVGARAPIAKVRA